MEEKKKRGRPPGALNRNRKQITRVSLSLDRQVLEAARRAASGSSLSLTEYVEGALSRAAMVYRSGEERGERGEGGECGER